MNNPIYTIGYTGRTPEEIGTIVRNLNAFLLDIRLHARSRHRRWEADSLMHSVGGWHYRCIKALGNVNYRWPERPIQIARLEKGLGEVEGYLYRPVFLMCACKEYEHCHRKVVAEALRERGYAVSEWGRVAEARPAVSQPLLTLWGD